MCPPRLRLRTTAYLLLVLSYRYTNKFNYFIIDVPNSYTAMPQKGHLSVEALLEVITSLQLIKTLCKSLSSRSLRNM